MTAAVTAPRPPPYLSRTVPRALVLGSFVVLGLPLAAYVLMASPLTASSADLPIVQAYVVLLGMTHFLLTFTVYLSSANLKHFFASRRNVFAFVAAPLVPLVGLACWYGFALDARFVIANAGLFMAIRALDFYHLSRQSFGVLQLFKGRGVPAWTRSAENLYFLALAVLIYITFLTDLRFDAHSALTWVAVAAAGGLLLAVLAGHAVALRAGADRRQAAIALAYLAVQTGSSLLAVYRTNLYVASLAVHYVEYHVLMSPRVFRAPLGEHDRALATARRSPLLLYGVLVALAIVWWLMRSTQPSLASGPAGTRVLVHLFDGIFVFHYVIEMSLWKFSDPYFGKSLGPLYRS